MQDRTWTAGAKDGWASALEDCEGALRRLLTGTVLRQVVDEPLEARHFHAARAQAHPCHALAIDWVHALGDGLDRDDPETIARVVASGALAPLGA